MPFSLSIIVGARSSPLSRAQVDEVLREIRHHRPEVVFKTIFVESTGDIDQITSLRDLGKTDFFTKEIDLLLLTGHCDIAIHSAKDLPEPLPEGLKIIALTQGLDSSDALVMRKEQSFETLPPKAKIATSSARREDVVAAMRPDLTFVDLRGTINQRLSLLDNYEVDGVVVAEAALIRLGLTTLNRIRLPGETTEGQGRLAILARIDDNEMRTLFSCIDTRDGNRES